MEEAKTYANKMDILYTDTWVDMEFFQQPCISEAERRNACKNDAISVKQQFYSRQQGNRPSRYANACWI